MDLKKLEMPLEFLDASMRADPKITPRGELARRPDKT